MPGGSGPSVADYQKDINTNKTLGKSSKGSGKAKPSLNTPGNIPAPVIPSPSGPGLAPAAQASGLFTPSNPINAASAPDFNAGPPIPMTDGSGGGVGGGTDFAALAKSIFGPQMANLDAQGGALRSQANATDSRLAGLYANLVKSINGDAQFYNQDNNEAQQSLAQTNQQAHASINNTYDQSAAKEAAILQRLGIQQAAPDVLQQGTTDRNFFGDLIDSNNAAYKNQFTGEHRADLSWNKQQGEVSQSQGVDARAKVAEALQAALAQLSSQRAGLQSQQMQEAQSLQSSQAANDLALTKLQLQYPNGAAGNAPVGKDPQSLLAADAKAIGYTDASAPNAIKAINDAVQYDPVKNDTLQGFLNFLHSRNKGANDWGQLQSLAEYMYKLNPGI